MFSFFFCSWEGIDLDWSLLFIYLLTSSLVIRPSFPVPWISPISILFNLIKCLTAGEAKISVFFSFETILVWVSTLTVCSLLISSFFGTDSKVFESSISISRNGSPTFFF